MGTKRVIVWKNRRIPEWTPELVARIGTISDAALAKEMGFTEGTVREKRLSLGIQSYRATCHVEVPCGTCGTKIRRKKKDFKRSRVLYCNHQCAAEGQRRRDSDLLRYGPGWKNRRAEIRKRDTACRACGKTPEENGSALHVHHLKPYRFRGTNQPANLVALCESCHHMIEAITNQVLDSIQIGVTLDGSSLTISVEGVVRWHGYVRGAVAPIHLGSNPSMALEPH